MESQPETEAAAVALSFLKVGTGNAEAEFLQSSKLLTAPECAAGSRNYNNCHVSTAHLYFYFTNDLFIVTIPTGNRTLFPASFSE